KSHTQGVAAEEFNAEDIKPFYSHWTFRGAAIFLTLGIGTMLFLGNPFKVTAPPPVPAEPKVVVQAHQAEPVIVVEKALPRGPEAKVHPYQGYTLHLVALVRGSRSGADYLNGYVVIANNGQRFN